MIANACTRLCNKLQASVAATGTLRWYDRLFKTKRYKAITSDLRLALDEAIAVYERNEAEVVLSFDEKCWLASLIHVAELARDMCI
jgi:hypothetical protein